MTDTMMPVIRQMLDADGDAVRAGILLSVPDLILAKYAGEFDKACAKGRFDLGREFIVLRLDAMRAVRDEQGLLPIKLDPQCSAVRMALMAIARGETAR